MSPDPERRWILTGPEVMEEAVVGFRAWRVAAYRGDVTLTSAVALTNERWPKDRPFEAVCLDVFNATHTNPPASGCKCGIFAFSDLRRLRLSFMERDFLFGEVVMWRSVAVHQYGYRARLARPSAIYVPRAWGPAAFVAAQRTQAEMVCRQYDIPLVQQPSLEVLGG